MRDHHDGLAPGLPDAQQFGAHVFAGERVERAEGLIQQQQVGVMDERAGDSHALGHPAGKGCRPGVHKILQADEFDQIAGFFPRFAFLHPQQTHGQQDVVQNCSPGHEVALLENEANAGLSPAGEGQPAFAGFLQTGEDAQQGGFAAARRTENAQEFALRHIHADITQDLQRAALVAEGDTQIPELDRRFLFFRHAQPLIRQELVAERG